MILALVFAAAASLGFSQTSGTTSTAASTNTVNATVISQGGGTPHQLIQAIPGPILGIFPGSAMGPGACYVYHPKLRNLKYLTESSIESMAKGGKLPHGVKVTLIDPDAAKAASYDGQVGVMEYDPTGDAINNKDIALAGITIPGKPFEINEALLGVAVKALRKVAPAMQRVAVLNCFIFAEVTDTSSKGVGIMASGTNATGQIGGSGTIGWFHGKSSTEQQRHVVTTVYALNGPYNLLTLPPPSEPKNGDRATAMPATARPTQLESKAPPVQTVRIEVVVAPPVRSLAPQSAPVLTLPVISCDLPAFVVDFGFNESNVKNEYRASIKLIATWLENHPACKVQAEGHASTEGTFAYNASLARLRAKAVYDILAEDKNIQGQLVQFVSLSKDKAFSERNPADRKVILRVIGSTSGR
jgi:outer membrane protein OmpA-like peptidoglycan-associated protein